MLCAVGTGEGDVTSRSSIRTTVNVEVLRLRGEEISGAVGGAGLGNGDAGGVVVGSFEVVVAVSVPASACVGAVAVRWW